MRRAEHHEAPASGAVCVDDPAFRQTTEAVCEGLDRAWWFFEGVPQTIVPDNTKAIVADPDALSPKLTESFTDYAQARNVFVDPPRVRRPKEKARVENQVPYVRESWFAGESFSSLEEARDSAAYWAPEIAGRRIHGTTRKVPQDVHESTELAAMQPPPAEAFDVPVWTDAKVHPDHHIQVARALYSVPTRYLYEKVRVRADGKLVKIYFGTELIKTHERQPAGGRSTDPNDYPIGKAAYALRSVEGVLDKARAKGKHIGIYAERILAGPLPWARMRHAYALLRLYDKYGDKRVEAVCQSALAFDVIDVKRIKRMLKMAKKPPRRPCISSSGYCPRSQFGTGYAHCRGACARCLAMPERCALGQNPLLEVHGRVGHASTAAGWTPAASLAAQADEPLVAALTALDQNGSMSEDSFSPLLPNLRWEGVASHVGTWGGEHHRLVAERRQRRARRCSSRLVLLARAVSLHQLPGGHPAGAQPELLRPGRRAARAAPAGSAAGRRPRP